MKRFVHPPADEITLPDLLYALGNPARLQIAKNLFAAKQPLTCQQSMEAVEDLPVATRSHCFRVLRDAGLVHSEKKGRECYNSLRTKERLKHAFPKLLAPILKNRT